MPRKRPETKRSKIAKMLIEEYEPQSVQDIQEVLKDLLDETMEELLKAVYKAPTEDLALTNLGIFEEKWDKKYPMCVNSWKNNWAELSTYFKYPEGILSLIHISEPTRLSLVSRMPSSA